MGKIRTTRNPREPIVLNQEDFDNTDLSQAKMQNAQLSLVGFQNANLSGLDLSNSALQVCFFQGANLQHSNLAGATIMFTNFNDADLKGAKFRSEASRYVENSKPLIATIDVSMFKNAQFNTKTIWPSEDFDPNNASVLEF